MTGRLHPTAAAAAAAAALAVIGAVTIAERLLRESALLIASWLAVTAAVILINVKTLDLTPDHEDVRRRLRTRLRTRRLRARISASRT